MATRQSKKHQAIYHGIDGPKREERDRISFALSLRRREALSQARQARFGEVGADAIRQVYDRLAASYGGEAIRADQGARPELKVGRLPSAPVQEHVLVDLEAQISVASKRAHKAAKDPAQSVERQPPWPLPTTKLAGFDRCVLR